MKIEDLIRDLETVEEASRQSQVGWNSSSKDDEKASGDAMVVDDASQFGPALAELKTIHKQLVKVRACADGAKVKLAKQVLTWDGDLIRLEAEEQKFFRDVANEKRVQAEEVGFDIATIKSALESCVSPEDYCHMVRSIIQSSSNGCIRVPMRWVTGGAKPKKRMINTTHQDTRDVERDTVCLNGELLRGAELTYDGVVRTIRELLMQKIPHEYLSEEELEVNKVLRDSLNRFARVIINIGNRTHSGGNAFEAIMLLFGGSELCIITPDSERADPVTINITVETFAKESGCAEAEEADQDMDVNDVSTTKQWGLLADVSATTKYMLMDPERVEQSIIGICGHFQQNVALSFPLALYPSPESDDNRCSIDNRSDYAVVTDNVAASEGLVTIVNWEN